MSNEQGSKQAKTEKESKNNASFSRGAPSSFLSSSFRQPRSPESPLFPPASAPRKLTSRRLEYGNGDWESAKRRNEIAEHEQERAKKKKMRRKTTATARAANEST